MSKSIDTVLAEHSAALERRELARQAFVAADADAQALTALIREQGSVGVPGSSLAYNVDWLRAGERASEALFKALLPHTPPQQIAAARMRWVAFLLETETAA
jgi:hypothetical protein